MKFAILGSGAVGGYYGAKLAQAGHQVTFLARGAHLQAIRERGLQIQGPLGDFTIRAAAESDPAQVGPVDVILLAVKTYDNDTALPMLRVLTADATVVLTLQNGVDSPDQAAATVGREKVLGGATYIATELVAPGVIRQTGTHRRIVFGEVLENSNEISGRTSSICRAFMEADIQGEAVADARVPLWEKFIYLSPFAGFTAAARLPVGPLWQDAGFQLLFLQAAAEVERVAHAEGIPVPPGQQERICKYIEGIPPTTRSSLLIDLSQGKRIEVEALQGSVVRRAARHGLPVPIMSTLYAVLRPYEHGPAAC